MAGSYTPPVLMTGTLPPNGEAVLSGVLPLDTPHHRAYFVTGDVIGFLSENVIGTRGAVPQYGAYKVWAIVRTIPGQTPIVEKFGQYAGRADGSYLPLYWDNLGYTFAFEPVAGGLTLKVSNVNNDFPTECSAALQAVDAIGV